MEDKKYLDALNKVLEKRYSFRDYSLKGYQEESTCLEKKGSTYLVYDGERNNHHREVKCDTIQIACIELFKHMTLDEEKIEEMKEELIKYVALD